MIHCVPDGIYPFINKAELDDIWYPKAVAALNLLINNNGPGSDFTGWFHLPSVISDLSDITDCAAKIRSDSDILIVIGIGGSYLGARSVIELLAPDIFGTAPQTKVLFAGAGLSGAYLARLIKSLDNKDFSINVISKSGTTTEPAVAFRILYDILRHRYGDDAPNRVYATTSPDSGALLQMSRNRSFTTFHIPHNIGGRFSVLTPVGLLPIAVAAIDIAALADGARQAYSSLSSPCSDNPALLYAAARQALSSLGRSIEVLSFWEPELRFFGEWYKQLFGESEGKQHKGIFPATLEMTADLHSMGQFLQDGIRSMFETFLWLEPAVAPLLIPEDSDNLDSLNYLAGKSTDYINRTALDATKSAHISGGVPSIELSAPPISPVSIGFLIYFFELSCAVSAYISGVNPFDQPGVEEYKRNMFKLLGKF